MNQPTVSKDPTDRNVAELWFGGTTQVTEVQISMLGFLCVTLPSYQLWLRSVWWNCTFTCHPAGLLVNIIPAIKPISLQATIMSTAGRDLLSITRAHISAPTPKRGHPFSTVTKWLVFITDLMIISSSIGRSDRRLITSASIPACSSSLAASRHMPTAREKDTIVTCLPKYTVTHTTFSVTSCKTQVFFMIRPVWAREHCRISPPRFLAECHKKRLNQGIFVLLCFALFAFSWLCLVSVFLICLLSCIFRHETTWMALYSLTVLMCR